VSKSKVLTDANACASKSLPQPIEFHPGYSDRLRIVLICGDGPGAGDIGGFKQNAVAGPLQCELTRID
jgi:hypothetical protein